MKRWLPQLFPIVMGAFTVILSSSSVTVAVSPLMGIFHAPATRVQWIVTVYLLTMGVAVPAAGWIGDRLGMKRAYLLAIAVFTLGAIPLSLAHSVTSLIIFRAVQGAAAGVVMPLTMAMIYRIAPRHEVGAAMGIWGIGAIMGPAIGPTVGGYLIQYVGWQALFAINVPLGAIALAWCLRVLPDFPSAERRPFDLLGFLLVAPGLFALLYALSEATTHGWGSPLIIGLILFAVVAVALFGRHERRIADPLIDLHLLTDRTFLKANAILAMSQIALYVGVFYVPLYLQQVHGLSPVLTGLVVMPSALGSALMSPLAGRIFDRHGGRYAILSGLTALTLATLLFSSLRPDTPVWEVLVFQAIRGLGLGFVMMPVQASGFASLPNSAISRASSITNIVQRVGASLGLAALTTVLEAHAAHFPGLTPNAAFTRGLDLVFLVAAVLPILAMWPAALLPLRHHRAARST